MVRPCHCDYWYETIIGTVAIFLWIGTWCLVVLWFWGAHFVEAAS